MNKTLQISISKKFKNTSLGFLRIKKNLNIIHFSDIETETYLRKIILATPLEQIKTKGKNHYFKCTKYNAILTVNSHTFTLITAKLIDKKMAFSTENKIIGNMCKINEKGNVAHYTKLNNVANILHDKQIKFSSIENLDDPRESSLGWLDTIGYGDGKGWENAHKLKQDVGSQLKIFCTAGESQSPEGSDILETSIYGRPRMWSQYGDNSKGFCVILNKEKLSKEISILVKGSKNRISGSVNYYEWLHMVSGGSCIEYGDGIDLDEIDILDIINKNEMLSSIFLKKSSDWAEEAEFRWLLFVEDKREIFISIQDAIEAVVLGWKFPQNQVSQVKAYCNSLNCPCYLLTYQHPKYSLLQL
jgi:hypothetical protein